MTTSSTTTALSNTEDEADAVLWRMTCWLSPRGLAPWHQPSDEKAALNKACLQSRQAIGPKESDRSASVPASEAAATSSEAAAHKAERSAALNLSCSSSTR